MVERTRIVGAPPPAVAWLVIRTGRRAGRDVRLGAQTTLGRDALKCEVILDDDSVSATHAQIRNERNSFVLYDLASTNGTYLNGRRTEMATLSDGDRIRIGRTTLIFKEVKPSNG